MVERYFISLCWGVVSIAMLVLNRSAYDVRSDFYLRVRSWWWMLGIITLVTFSGYIGFEILLLFFAAYGGMELLRAESLSRLPFFFIVTILPVAIFMILVDSFYVSVSLLFIAVSLLIFSHQVSRNLKFVLVLLYVLLFIAIGSMVKLLYMTPIHKQGSLLLYLFCVTQASDVSQYFWGKYCGKVLLLPKVSPNKTLEGAIGGVLTSSLLSTVVGYYLLAMPLIYGFFLSLLLAIAGIGGDILVSLFKRRRGIKDMGKLIPGHGGLLDRIDSLLLSAPLLWLLTA